MIEDPPAARGNSLRPALERILDRESPAPGDLWLVAFSGGPDSTALAAGLAPLAAERRLRLRLVHLDHRLDPGSEQRAREAGVLADRIGLPFRLEVRDVPAERRRRESLEMAARRVRYRVLEEVRAELGAARILTAHQRDDQVETILLRLLAGAPVEDLGGIPGRRGAILRPLLEIPRSEIDALLAALGLEAVQDPTNRNPASPRNRVRFQLLPHLRAADPAFDEELLGLSRAAISLRARLDRAFSGRLTEASSDGGMETSALFELPESLRARALRWYLHSRTPGRLPSSPSLEAFLKAVESPHRRREAHPELRLSGARLRLAAREGQLLVEPTESRIPPFSYTLQVPGEVGLPELGLRVRIRRSPVEEWMFRGDRSRTALAFGPEAPRAVVVRNRRPGDRLRPLGSPGERKLKAVLIDRRVPGPSRDRLPLLEVGGRIAWVPGVTIDEAFRLRGESECWVAELEPLDRDGNGPSGEKVEPVEREPR
jgi:tRNA(Ile)-lysidine synthase